MYPSDAQYTNDHEWIRIADGTADVGITDYAQKQLGDVVYVDLPEVGRAVTAGQAFGTIESVKAVSELFAPVSGTVTAVNAALQDHPEAVNARPHETWLIQVAVSDPAEATGLLDSAQYEALVGE